jgi:hypothetical protein
VSGVWFAEGETHGTSMAVKSAVLDEHRPHRAFIVMRDAQSQSNRPGVAPFRKLPGNILASAVRNRAADIVIDKPDGLSFVGRLCRHLNHRTTIIQNSFGEKGLQ